MQWPVSKSSQTRWSSLPMQWPVSSSSHTRPSGFSRINTEEGFEEYLTWDSTDSSLVSSRTHAQLEEEDPTDESTKVEGGHDREGKR
jgi:hypothetical protein